MARARITPVHPGAAAVRRLLSMLNVASGISQSLTARRAAGSARSGQSLRGP